MSKLVTPFKVGLLVLGAGIAFFVFFSFVRETGLDASDSLKVFAYFDDASGLGLKSRVQTAGIAVGEVTDIRLEGTRARIEVRVRKDVPLKKDAVLYKRSESVLGDYLLDLMPGTRGAEPMPDGGQIVNVVDKTGMDQAFDRLNLIADDIQAVTASLRKVLGGDQGTDNLQAIMQNMVELSANLDRTVSTSGEKLNQVLENLEGFSGGLRNITAGQEDNYARIILNVRGATEDVRDVLRTVKQVVGSGEGELKESAASLKMTLARLDSTLKNLESVTAKIDNGEGTLGQLVNDKELGTELRTTVSDASDFVGKMVGVLTEVTLRSEFHLNQRGSKNYLQLRVIPKPDKYYLFEIVDDPRGVLTEQTVVRMPPDADERELQTQLVTERSLKFSAQFAKRYYFATLRFGIIESTGGVGANLHFLDDSLTLAVDLFEFSAQNKDYPRLKAFANYSFLGHVFVTAGVDDALNRTIRDSDLISASASNLATRRVISGRDVFLGAGIYFTDDDLKAMLAAIPIPKP